MKVFKIFISYQIFLGLTWHLLLKVFFVLNFQLQYGLLGLIQTTLEIHFPLVLVRIRDMVQLHWIEA